MATRPWSARTSQSQLLGTTGWRQQVVDFVTGPEARLITIRVIRVPGNPLIKGTFWLDDVQLATVSTSGKTD
jgi:type IV secretory pathway VirB2 component (pilin)